MTVSLGSDTQLRLYLLQHIGCRANKPSVALMDDFPSVHIPISLAKEPFSTGQVKILENFTEQRYLHRHAIFIHTLWPHLGPEDSFAKQRKCGSGATPEQSRCGLEGLLGERLPERTRRCAGKGSCTSRGLHLEVREQRIAPEVTAENYFDELRDASLNGDGATLEKTTISEQPKLYLLDNRHYVAGLQRSGSSE